LGVGWKLAWIAVAGAVGTLARYGLGGLVQNAVGTLFPWGTVVVNLVGCLAFGLVISILGERFTFSGELRMILLTGFMGAFTTFSTFMYETEQLLEGSQWGWAVGNLALQNVVGLLAVFVGLALGRLI
jgi:fluoride exporter